MTSVVRLKRRLLTASILAVMVAAGVSGYVGACSTIKPQIVVREVAVVVTAAPTAPEPIIIENHVGQLDRETAYKFLRSVVQVRTENGGGAGIVLRSVEGKNGAWRTYVLTAAHVVAGIDTATVVDFSYFKRLRIAYTTTRFARVIKVSEPLDVALLQVGTDEDMGRKNELVTNETIDGVEIYDPVFAVGCPGLEPPSITDGHLVGLSRMVLRVSCPVAGGNSGGPVFLQDGRVIGIITGMKGMHGPYGPMVVNHMAVATASPIIALWLRCIGAGFLAGEKGSTVESFEQRCRPVGNAK